MSSGSESEEEHFSPPPPELTDPPIRRPKKAASVASITSSLAAASITKKPTATNQLTIMSDPPSSKPDISGLNYEQAKMYQNVIALDPEDPSIHPPGIECFIVRDVNVMGVRNKEISVDKLVVLISATSEDTADLASGIGAISFDGTAFTLNLVKQDGARVEKHDDFCSEVAVATESAGHKDNQIAAVSAPVQLELKIVCFSLHLILLSAPSSTG